jgi:hypothetical protein
VVERAPVLEEQAVPKVAAVAEERHLAEPSCGLRRND